MNKEFTVQLTPKDYSLAYCPRLPANHPKKDILVDLAFSIKMASLQHCRNQRTRAPYLRRNPNGKLKLLVDLRKYNNLISDDFITNNHPVSTLTDAAQNVAGKKLFCKRDCSHAYHCLQMANQRSIQMLCFNFASRTFAYRRLAQGLSRALMGFSSFLREKFGYKSVPMCPICGR